MGSLALVKQPVKENSEFKPLGFHLKINLVSHPAHGRGLVGWLDFMAYQPL